MNVILASQSPRRKELLGLFRIPFTDLPEWAFESIAWCYMKNITTGTSETTFSPDQPCTRGQIVTFLYRAFAESEN